MDHPYINNPSNPFLGDFDLLPISAHFAHGEVPTHPTSDDFQLAAMKMGDSHDAVDLWYLEAIRQRVLHPGQLLEEGKKDINARLADRLFKICRG